MGFLKPKKPPLSGKDKEAAWIIKVVEHYALLRKIDHLADSRQIADHVRQKIKNATENVRKILRYMVTNTDQSQEIVLVSLSTNLKRLFEVLETYLKVLKTPALAGEKYSQVVSDSESAFQGFLDETNRLLGLIGKKELFSAQVYATILTSFKNLLPQKEET